MQELFFILLRLSLTGSLLAIAVMLLRLAFRKAPKWLFCLLWGLVALRLICPFTIKAPVSLVPEEVASGDLITALGDTYVGKTRTIYLYEGDGPPEGPPLASFVTDEDLVLPAKTVKETVYPLLPWIWLCGAVLMVLYTGLSYFLLWKRMAEATRLQGNIWQCEKADSPFVLGVIRPRIYLPYSVPDADLFHVIAHERAHIRRKDHWWKPLAFLLLSIHWFNPVLWLAYILLCRDIEAACDEKVIRNMEKSQLQAYSKALLNCSVRRRSIAACPLAFGEVGVKTRIKSVMHYKKPAFWVVIATTIVCAAVATCFLTNPGASVNEKLSIFIDCQIAEHHQTMETRGRASCVNWKVLGMQRRGRKTTVYMWVLYEEYSQMGDGLLLETGSHIPTVITAKKEDGNYRLVEYWEPSDGAYLEPDINEKFPWYLRHKALNSQRYIKRQHGENLAMAQDYFKDEPRPQIRNLWIQDYVPGADGIIGNVDTEKYTRVSADFAIGADRRGMAVFKDPHKAFQTLTVLYAEGIAAIQSQYDLPPLTADDYEMYKVYGWQTDTGSAKAKEQAAFVTGFLDIYENSFIEEAPETGAQVVDVIRTKLQTYYKLSDGTWRAEGRNYKYRLVITGRLHNAVADSTYVYLSNIENITFEQAWKAGGLSSDLNDYFKPEDALLVDMWVGPTDS